MHLPAKGTTHEELMSAMRDALSKDADCRNVILDSIDRLTQSPHLGQA